MKLIVHTDRNGGIGKDGKLLLHIPEDMQRFKSLTMGKTVVMGRKTLESLPGGKPLPGRRNVVLTRNKSYHADGVTVCGSIDEIKALDGEIFIIGGGEIYSQLIDECDTAYIKRSDFDGNADTFMPPLGDEWVLSECEEREYKEIRYKFETYIKI